MKIYRVDEFHAEDDTIQYGILICALETEKEAEAYDKELWDSLLAPFGYTDDDISYYASPDEKIEDIQKGAYGIHLEGEYQFEEDEPIVKLDDGFAVDLTMTVYLPSDGYNEAMSKPLYAQSEKSAKNLAEGVVCGILEESELQVVDISAKSARTFKYKQTGERPAEEKTPEEIEAEYIRTHNLDITKLLEHLGYFQHILMGKEDVRGRAKTLYECEDLDIPKDIDAEEFYQRLAEHVTKNCDFSVLNIKTGSMSDADADVIDSAILDSAKNVENEIRIEKEVANSRTEIEKQPPRKPRSR